MCFTRTLVMILCCAALVAVSQPVWANAGEIEWLSAAQPPAPPPPDIAKKVTDIEDIAKDAKQRAQDVADYAAAARKAVNHLLPASLRN